MKRFVFILIVTILLTSGIWSCRTSSSSKVDFYDTTSVVMKTNCSESLNSSIISLIKASKDVDISAIKLEFYHPDSVQNHARDSPKSLTFENVKVKEATEQVSKVEENSVVQQADSLAAQSATNLHEDSKKESKTATLKDWLMIYSFAAITIIALVYIAGHIKKV